MTSTLTPIKILSTLAVRNVLNEIAPDYVRRTGRMLEMTFALLFRALVILRSL